MAKQTKRLLDEIVAGKFLNSASGGPKLDDELTRSLGEGEGEKSANAGVVGDLFNLLARPARASATAALYATDTNPDTTVVQGVKEGLSGKSKASYADVLGQAGITGKPGAALGFIGDVLLDPLTYTGVRTQKGINAAEAATTALRSGFSSDAVEAEIARLQAENPAHAYATLFGRKVSPSVKFAPATKIKDVLIGEEGNRRTIAKAFSKQSELPFGLADSASVYESGSAAGFHNHVRDIRNIFKDLTADERTRIAHAIDQGEELNVPVTLKQPREGFTNLGDYQRLAKGITKRYFDDEVKLKILGPDQFNENYVYRYFRKPPESELPGVVKDIKTKVGGPDTASFTLKRAKDVSLQEAKELGYDPVEDIAQILELRSAKHYRTVGRAQFVNDAVERFGVDMTPKNREFLKKNGWLDASTSIVNPITDHRTGTFLPKPVIEAVNATERTLRDGSVGSKFMKTYDKILKEWKFLNTAVSPGYHIRNTFTDALLNTADGVLPQYYSQARRILHDVNAKDSQGLLDYVQNGQDLGRDIGHRWVKLGGKNMSTHEVWEKYGQSGAKSGYISTELENNLGSLSKAGVTNYASKAKRTIGDAANQREDFFRLAHFLHATDDELRRGKTFDTAMTRASQRVRKYNIDYSGLSSFERNQVSKVVPFYAFMRKNLPLQMELLFTKPGFMSLYPKGQDLAQGLLGTDDGTGDSLIPQWIRETAPVRLALAKKEANSPLGKLLQKLAGASPDEAVTTATLGGLTPLGDLNQIIEPLNRGLESGPIAGINAAARNAIGMASPAITSPIELGTQQNLYTGGKIEGAGDWGQWLAGKLGPSRVATQAATGNPKALTSFLAGLPLQPVTKERQASEFKRREDIVNQAQKRSKLQALRRTPNYNALPPPAQQRMLARIKTPESERYKVFLNNLRPPEKA